MQPATSNTRNACDRAVATRLAMLASTALLTGCAAFPTVVHEPQFHNPFPQLSKVAVAPFYNQSAEPTVSGERFAIAYSNELQQIPGFEVVPVGAVRRVMLAHGIRGDSAADYRKLAQVLGVDAVLVGTVTEYTPYYPPRYGLKVNWYSANPCFHEIPPGYGLPWGTAEEEYIPDRLVYEAELALAKAQLATQTPAPPVEMQKVEMPKKGGDAAEPAPAPPPGAGPEWFQKTTATVAASESQPAAGATAPATPAEAIGIAQIPDLPPDWPDPRGFVPDPPSSVRPQCIPHQGPVITHTRLYNGADADLTTALSNYFYFRDDARFGGWQGYLQRSEDFIRFCSYMHLAETLSARGGAGKTRLVFRWPIGRYEE